MVDAWHTMSHDHSLFPLIADYLLELVTTGCGSSATSETPFEVLDTGAGSSVKIVKPEVCALAAAIAEVVKVTFCCDQLLTFICSMQLLLNAVFMITVFN